MEQKELHAELLKFTAHLARLSIWDYDKDDGSAYQECEEPSDGHLDSHSCLMNMIERARSILEKPASNKVPSNSYKPEIKLVVEVGTTDDYGDCPTFAVISVNSALLEKLLHMREYCAVHQWESISARVAPDLWDMEDELNIQCESLLVLGDSFVFSGIPKHTNYTVETHSIEIAALTHMISSGKDDPAFPNFYWDEGVLFYNADPDQLPDLIDNYRS